MPHQNNTQCNLRRSDAIFTIQNFIRDLVVKNENLTQCTLTDDLTQLFNRGYLDSRLNQEFAKCKRYDHKMCMLMLDIDYFKKINDNYGHQTGDEVLQKMVRIAPDFYSWAGVPIKLVS